MKEYEVTITKTTTIRSVFIQAEDWEDLEDKISNNQFDFDEDYVEENVDFDIDDEEEVEDE